jgi:hypothetical protein
MRHWAHKYPNFKYKRGRRFPRAFFPHILGWVGCFPPPQIPIKTSYFHFIAPSTRKLPGQWWTARNFSNKTFQFKALGTCGDKHPAWRMNGRMDWGKKKGGIRNNNNMFVVRGTWQGPMAVCNIALSYSLDIYIFLPTLQFRK